jgi:hypothetical protein
MLKDTTIIPFRQPDAIDDPLTEVAREGARRMLAQVLIAEADAFVALWKDLKLPDGRDRVVRHGHGPQRAIQTGVGPVEVRRAKVRDRGDVGTPYGSGSSPSSNGAGAICMCSISPMGRPSSLSITSISASDATSSGASPLLMKYGSTRANSAAAVFGSCSASHSTKPWQPRLPVGTGLPLSSFSMNPVAAIPATTASRRSPPNLFLLPLRRPP